MNAYGTWQELSQRILTTSQIRDVDRIVVDAMLGTAAKGPPRSPYREWITIANSIQGNRIAIDIPTGIDAETGEHSDCYFEADLTLTLVARKPAMPGENTRHLFGEIEVLPIGTPSGLNSQILADQ